MTEPTETRESLLIRLRDPAADAAWQEFSDIYRPMVMRIARQSGLQANDAEDVAQRVLVSVSQAIGSWQKDSSKGRFRGWITVVTKNAIRNAISRAPREKPAAGTELRRLIEDRDSADVELEHRIEDEFMRCVFREAARRVQAEFADATWQAFWLTSVEGRTSADVGKQLKLTQGAVYTARSRVMRRLQQVALELTHEEDT